MTKKSSLESKIEEILMTLFVRWNKSGGHVVEDKKACKELTSLFEKETKKLVGKKEKIEHKHIGRWCSACIEKNGYNRKTQEMFDGIEEL